MTKCEENSLKNEITHIFETGATDIRIFEMIERWFIKKRYIIQSNGPKSALVLPEQMTMRDEFAARVIQAIISFDGKILKRDHSERAYEMADEMMKARKV